MRTFSALLAAAALLAPVAALGETTADAAQKAVQDITGVLNSTGEEALEDGAIALEILKLRVDEKGCYHLTGPESGLSLLLCEDDLGAHKQYTEDGVIADLAAFPETNEGTFSWVNGTITNLGQVAICGVAFASRDTDLQMDAVDIFPGNLPTTTLDEEVFDTVDLAPGEKIDFAYFVPFDDARNAPVFVGLANSLHACPEAVEKFVPELPEMEEVAAGAADLADAANVAVDDAQEATGGVLDTVKEAAQKLVDGTGDVAKDLVEGTEEKLDAAIDAIQDLVKAKQPEEEVAAPATTEGKPVADAAADTKAVEEQVAPKAARDEPPSAELPTKEAQKGTEATSPAGTRSASGSVLVLGMIAALSVVALFV